MAKNQIERWRGNYPLIIALTAYDGMSPQSDCGTRPPAPKAYYTTGVGQHQMGSTIPQNGSRRWIS